jgi:hypothetical protein
MMTDLYAIAYWMGGIGIALAVTWIVLQVVRFIRTGR